MVLRPSLLRTALVALFAAVLAFAPAQAADIVIETVVEYEIVESDEDWAADIGTAQRHAPASALQSDVATGARFGPFTVVDDRTVRMAGSVTGATPRQFAAMLSAHPGLTRLELIDCPGSLDEEANLRLARMVRRAGLATHIPEGGSVRSGAVELFLAGVTRSAHPSAEFGVHSWRDEAGLEASDYPVGDPVHAEYLNYYREMGLDAEDARAFYAMTNASGYDDIRYLTKADIARYVALN
ncbi:MAG: alpha/beta hydrolase [Sphingopyxis sp.]|nr:alpha/beta hydrolase [Sphingopyxis sp.]